jgi:hypothetical protein
MKNVAFAFLLSFGFCSVGYSQDFSFDELSKLRANDFSTFETKVHDKGYELDHLEKNETSSIYRKGANVIAFSHIYDDGFSYHTHVAIKYETADKTAYEKLKAQVLAAPGMTYFKTRLVRKAHRHYMEHVYVNDKVSVHLYDIIFDDDNEPYFEIEVKSIYAAY